MTAPEPTPLHVEANPLDALTAREREVLACIARGLTNKRIGIDLGISHRTVEVHRARLMRKLGAHNLVTLLDVAFARRGEG
ncbi:MAG TPA: helix-turn-helix transcriptional regulator [Sphingobium sp.]